KGLTDRNLDVPGGDKVEEGLNRTYGGMGLLYWAGGKVSNCRIRVVYKMRDVNDNSGVYIRIPIEPREAWMPVHYGYEVQIDNHPETSNEDDTHITGTLYSLTKPLAKPGKPGPEWNTMVITLDGPHTMVELNGVKVTDYTEGQPVPERKFDFEPLRGPRPSEGWFGLQNDSDRDAVFLKEVSIQSLKYLRLVPCRTVASLKRDLSFVYTLAFAEGFMKTTRRQFLQKTAGTAGALAVSRNALIEPEYIPTALEKVVPPSDTLRFGIIGVGMQGSGLLATAITLPG